MSDGQNTSPVVSPPGERVANELSAGLIKVGVIHLVTFAFPLFILTYVASDFIAIFEEFGASLPGLTRLVIAFSAAVGGNGVLTVACLGLVFGVDILVAAALYQRDPRLGSLWTTGVVIAAGLLTGFMLVALYLPIYALEDVVSG